MAWLVAFLLRRPKTDYLNLTLADVNELDEGLAIKLFDKLTKAREETAEAYRKASR